MIVERLLSIVLENSAAPFAFEYVHSLLDGVKNIAENDTRRETHINFFPSMKLMQ